MWKCGNALGVVISNGVRREADEVRNLVLFFGTKYIGIGIIYLDVGA